MNCTWLSIISCKKSTQSTGFLSLSDCVFYTRNIPLFIQRFSGGGDGLLAGFVGYAIQPAPAAPWERPPGGSTSGFPARFCRSHTDIESSDRSAWFSDTILSGYSNNLRHSFLLILLTCRHTVDFLIQYHYTDCQEINNNQIKEISGHPPMCPEKSKVCPLLLHTLTRSAHSILYCIPECLVGDVQVLGDYPISLLCYPSRWGKWF